MADSIPVDFCGLVLDNEPDADGTRYRALELIGYGASSLDAGQVAPTGQHGLALTGSWWRERRVTVRGRAQATSSAAAWAAYERLVALAPLLATGSLTVYHPTPKFLTVALGGTPQISEPTGSHRVKFQIPVVAEYPFKRTLTSTTVTIPAGGSLTFTAGGKRPAEIEVETTAAGTVSLSAYGSTQSMGATVLPAGSVMRSIDRTVLDDTGADAGAMPGGFVWLAVKPGSNTFTNNGTAPVTLTYYDTFA